MQSIKSYLLRGRYQLLSGLLFCLLFPAAIRVAFDIKVLSNNSFLTSSFGAFCAILAGFFAWRQISKHPTSGVYYNIFWSFTLSFIIVIFTFLLFRIDYNRYIFFTTMILSPVWYSLITRQIIARQQYHFGIIPHGNVKELNDHSNRKFFDIKSPDENLHNIEGVIVDLRHNHSEIWEKYITELTLKGIPVYHYKQILEEITGKVSIEILSENNFGSLLPSVTYLKFKSTLDKILVILLLPILLPLTLVTALFIKFFDNGPIFFKQERMGFKGVPFTVVKFRTMKVSDQNKIHKVDDAITKENDDRITTIGKKLRKYRLDELPQIINILKGEMSWIGPRPEAMELSKRYEEHLSFYRYRHAVIPGITGWAQVNQGHVTSVQDIDEKLKYDFYYIKHISIWMDFLVAVRTIQTVTSGFGSK